MKVPRSWHALLILLAFSMPVQTARAAEIHSNGVGGGDWSDPASWREKTVPTAEDDAVIARGDDLRFDRDDESRVTCKQIFIDPKGTLSFKSGSGRATCCVAGQIESYGTIKIDGSKSADDRFELRLLGKSREERTIKLKRAALLVSGRQKLPHGRHNVAITTPEYDGFTAKIEVAAGSMIDLQRAELVNMHLAVNGIDNTGAKANERLNVIDNHFSGVSHVTLATCDSPLIADNLIELTGAPASGESALYIIACPLAEIRGNTIRGRYSWGIQGRQQIDSAVTQNTFESCVGGVYWYGNNGMLKRLTVRSCDTGIHASTMSGVLEDIRIEGCKTAYSHASATAQLTNVEIVDLPKDGVAVVYLSGPLTLLNCNILPDQIKMAPKALATAKDGVPMVEWLSFVVVQVRGSAPAGTMVELKTTSPAPPSRPDAADANVRNSPAKLAPGGLTPLPETFEPLIVRSWTIDDEGKTVAPPQYKLSIVPPAKAGQSAQPLASMQITPDETWYRADPNAKRATVEVSLP